MRNPIEIKVPYFIPGYTGHCPFMSSSYGITYGLATKRILKKNPRVASILNIQPVEKKRRSKIVDGKHSNKGQIAFSAEVIPGYAGHVPRRKYVYGITYGKDCAQGVKEFNKICHINETRLKNIMPNTSSATLKINKEEENVLNLIKDQRIRAAGEQQKAIDKNKTCQRNTK